MRGSRVRKQQSKRKNRERREETDGGRAEVQGGKENKPLIIYLEDTSSSTFSSGQWCSAKNKVLCKMLCSVGKLSHDLNAVYSMEVCAHSDWPGVLRCLLNPK